MKVNRAGKAKPYITQFLQLPHKNTAVTSNQNGQTIHTSSITSLDLGLLEDKKKDSGSCWSNSISDFMFSTSITCPVSPLHEITHTTWICTITHCLRGDTGLHKQPQASGMFISRYQPSSDPCLQTSMFSLMIHFWSFYLFTKRQKREGSSPLQDLQKKKQKEKKKMCAEQIEEQTQNCISLNKMLSNCISAWSSSVANRKYHLLYRRMTSPSPDHTELHCW